MAAAEWLLPRPPAYRFGRQVALPVLSLVAAAMLAVVAFVGYSAQRQSEDAQRQSVRAARSALATKLEEVARTAQDYSWWDEAVRHLDLALNEAWAENNVGRYIRDTFGYDATFVVDRDDATRYAVIDGEVLAADAFERVAGLEHLIATARAIPREEPGAAGGYLRFDGALSIVGASPITPETDFAELPAGPRPVLVYAKRLDADFLGTLGEGLGLDHVRVTDAAAMIPLAAPNGAPLGGLVWEPRPLGREFLRDILPSLVLAFGLITGCTSLILRQARRAALIIEASEARFRDVADASADWIWEADAAGRLIIVSDRFAEIMDAAPQRFLARPLGELFEDHDGSDDAASLAAAMERRQAVRDLLCRVKHGAGGNRILRFAAKPRFGHDGRFCGYRGTASDVTAQITAEQRARYLALHDAVTELPNREMLRQRLEPALAGLRDQDGMVAILVVDLDRLKNVNDTLGHAAGDALIKLCARRLQACVREADTVARLGGDEFAIVQVGVEDPSQVQALCRRLLAAVVQPYDLDGHEVITTASIGVALAPYDGHEPDHLLRAADLALYRAKEEGRNTFRFFEPAMDRRLRARRALERELRVAVVQGKLEIHYQIQVNLRSGAPVGVEALVRWQHPQRGWLAPEEFIPVAEETGMILPLGEWVMREACAQVAAWPGLRLSVNVSPVQFRHGDLVALVADALLTSGLDAGRLQIEITEGVLLGDTIGALGTLQRLRNLGVEIAMDDFGTGYSSLSYLQRFPFDAIKIDQCFVGALATQSDACAIVRAMIGLGHSLRMRTCAEGVESAAQLAILRTEGCDEAQGYHLSRPMPPRDIARLLEHAAAVAPPTLAVVD